MIILIGKEKTYTRSTEEKLGRFSQLEFFIAPCKIPETNKNKGQAKKS